MSPGSMSVLTRLRVVSGDARLAVGATIGVLMVLVPSIVLVSLLATGHAGDLGGLAVLGLLIAGGCYVCVSSLLQAGAAPPPPRTVVVTDSTGLYGRTVEVPQHTGPAPSARKAVLAILAALVVLPIVFAIAMSFLDDYTFGRPLVARLVVIPLVAVLVVATRWVVRRVVQRRRR